MAVFTMSDQWWSPSSSDFYVGLETPWSNGNGVSSSVVVSALVALALHNCPVLLSSLSVLPHSGCRSIQCAHRSISQTIQQLSNSTIEKHTIHTLQTGRGKSLFVCLLLAFAQQSVIQKLYEREDICTNHAVQIILTWRLFQELMGRNTNPWNRFKIP